MGLVHLLFSLCILIVIFETIECEEKGTRSDSKDEKEMGELLGEISFEKEDIDLKKLYDPMPNTLSVFIDVVLVGFEGDGKEKLRLDPNILLSRLEFLKMSDHIHVVDSTKHLLSANVNTKYKVRLAKTSLLQEIKSSLANYFSKVEGETSISYDTIDGIIQNDHVKNSDSYAIYIINTPILKNNLTYWYSAYPSNDPLLGTDCGTSLWISEGRNVWVDLTAKVVDFGPKNGEGIVTETSIPTISQFKGAKQFKYNEFYSSLSSFVSRVTEHTIVPPVSHLAISDGQINFVLVHIKNGPTHSSDFSFELVKNSFLKGMHYYSYHINFVNYELSQIQTDHCLLALKDSVFKTTNLNGETIYEVNSQELHENLSLKRHFLVEIFKGLHGRVIPVFFYDLIETYNFHDSPAVSFKDMVIAIQSDQTTYYSNYVCRGRELHHVIKKEDRSMFRPIAAAFMQTAWAVHPTYETWSTVRGVSVKDYSFSIGNTVFGPFSIMKSVSNSIRDTVIRNLCLFYLNRTIEEIENFYDRLKDYNMTLEEVFNENELLDFYVKSETTRRKLDRGLTSLSSQSHKFSVFFFRSMRNDLSSVRYMLSHATSRLLTSLHCHNHLIHHDSDMYLSIFEFLLTLSAVYLSATIIKKLNLVSFFQTKTKKKN